MCIRDRTGDGLQERRLSAAVRPPERDPLAAAKEKGDGREAVSYTHLRAHETVLDLVCRLLLEKKKEHS